jgi:Ca2+:H+ antiporter
MLALWFFRENGICYVSYMMAPTDTTPLLENGSSLPPRPTSTTRIADLFMAEGEPSWLASYKYLILSSWLNTALVFVPLSIFVHHFNWDAAFRFSFSFFAIIPLAKVCGCVNKDFAVVPNLAKLSSLET